MTGTESMSMGQLILSLLSSNGTGEEEMSSSLCSLPLLVGGGADPGVMRVEGLALHSLHQGRASPESCLGRKVELALVSGVVVIPHKKK